MKTQNKKLIFKKDSITELNDEYLLDIEGGSTYYCISLSVAIASVIISMRLR